MALAQASTIPVTKSLKSKAENNPNSEVAVQMTIGRSITGASRTTLIQEVKSMTQGFSRAGGVANFRIKGNRLEDLPMPEGVKYDVPAQACTQVVKQMIHPETGESRTATDGCEVDSLREQGFVPANGNAGPPSPPNGNGGNGSGNGGAGPPGSAGPPDGTGPPANAPVEVPSVGPPDEVQVPASEVANGAPFSGRLKSGPSAVRNSPVDGKMQFTANKHPNKTLPALAQVPAEQAETLRQKLSQIPSVANVQVSGGSGTSGLGAQSKTVRFTITGSNAPALESIGVPAQYTIDESRAGTTGRAASGMGTNAVLVVLGGLGIVGLASWAGSS